MSTPSSATPPWRWLAGWSCRPVAACRTRTACPPLRCSTVSRWPASGLRRAERRGAHEDTRMSEPYIGEIQLFGFDFAPRHWAYCNGAIVPIQQNTALYALLGSDYGGNGTTTFALPNLANLAAGAREHGPGQNARRAVDIVY